MIMPTASRWRLPSTSSSLAMRMILAWLIVTMMARTVQAASQQEINATRAMFDSGRIAVESCLPSVADTSRYAHCILDVIWRPHGELFRAVPMSRQAGAHYGDFIQTARIGRLGLPTDLDRDVREIAKGNFQTYCSVFAIDCNELLKYRRETYKAMPPNVLKALGVTNPNE